MWISKTYLREHPDHIFVFGDNKLRRGKKGAAFLRDEPNSYGFITKKIPTFSKEGYYKPKEYRVVFKKEMEYLKIRIESNLDKTILISELGSGLANKYKIWEKVIKPGLEELRQYDNVVFLWEV